jgi:hypothetical protein
MYEEGDERGERLERERVIREEEEIKEKERPMIDSGGVFEIGWKGERGEMEWSAIPEIKGELRSRYRLSSRKIVLSNE